jgi:tetraacyldisaccharide 4'-kinase
VSAALRPLSRLYGIGTAVRGEAYRRGWLRRQRLGRPVVSVGNLTAGGTGKTPLVRWLGERLSKQGLRPAILTRGYRRQNGPDAILIPPKPDRAPEPCDVGDEAAWLARALPDVAIGVSADRFRIGQIITESFPVDVFVLDDGFQHLTLARDVDIVTLDATRRVSDREILPAGLQREPCSALARAHLVVITRTELADPLRLETLVRRIHAGVPIVRACTAPDHLIELPAGNAFPLETYRDRPIHAFCGLGNPEAFFRDLRLWGFNVIRESVFPDHHLYRNLRFARGGPAAALLTTEKDAMNLASVNWAEAGVPVAACAMRLEIADGAAVDELVLSHLGHLARRVQNGENGP